MMALMFLWLDMAVLVCREWLMSLEFSNIPVKIREILIPNFKRVILFDASTSNVEGVIAVHNTTLGPALGGCRIKPYDLFSSGFDDALSLARAMTYKNAIMSLPFGGGKAVIFHKPGVKK
jgi:leucine dehydrogenase